jgi:hypothetical protein
MESLNSEPDTGGPTMSLKLGTPPEANPGRRHTLQVHPVLRHRPHPTQSICCILFSSVSKYSYGGGWYGELYGFDGALGTKR